MCENLNVHVLHTATESLWQNGVCEYDHALVDWYIKKNPLKWKEFVANVVKLFIVSACAWL